MSTSTISQELRRRVFDFSRFWCGYCQTSQLIIGPYLEIDHIIPEAQGGTSEDANLITACSHCNNRNGARLTATDPQTKQQARLFNPRTDTWQEHFKWIDDGAVIRGKTIIGSATVAGLEMNHPDLVAARRLWVNAGWHPPQD